MLAKYIILCGFLLHAGNTEDEKIWCRNPDGKRVEWFILYKAPKTAGSISSGRRYELKGSEFGYIDSETVKNSEAFREGEKGIYTEENNPLAKSLARLFKRQKTRADRELTYIVYNDQPPKSITNTTTNGHSKGIVIFGDQGGLWIIHSVPRFPENVFSGKYSFPKSARENGQSFLCVTMNPGDLNTIAIHLRRQNPNVYAASAPSKVQQRNEDLHYLINKRYLRRQPYLLKDSILAINGTVFTAFAKGGPLNEDIYSSVIAPTLHTDLYVESWRNGNGGKLPSNCSTRYRTNDIQKIGLRVGGKTMRWSSQEDHSKWAVGTSGNWVCLGSINRMYSQFKRGGETMCFQDPVAHRLFSNAILALSDCIVNGTQSRSERNGCSTTRERN